MDYCVQLAFENINSSEVNGYGVDHVKVAEGLGRLADQAEIGVVHQDMDIGNIELGAYRQLFNQKLETCL
jgi:glyoxylate carboligase